MPNKLQMITELSNETIKEIAKSPRKWIDFLDTASNNYKYSFNDQILIYAQRPNAKVCAEMETWNRRLHRWIKKGAKGIALLQNKNGYLALRHVFDISDTYDKFERPFNPWTIPKGSEQQIIESLENSFGTLEFKDNLEDAIVSSVRNSVEDNIQDYLSEFKDIIEGSLLEEYDDFNLDYNFKTLMINSISYMMLKRCGYDPADYFDIDDFNNIVEYDTTETISRFGIAMSDIVEVELHEIYTTVLDIQKNKKRTFEQNDLKNYDDNNNKDENKIYNGRGNENERDKISSGGRLYDSQPNNRAEESATRQMGENENEIHSGTQERFIYGIDDEGDFNQLSIGDRPNSIIEDRANNKGSSQEKQHRRAPKVNRPVTMGWLDEQLQESSGGDSSAGTNIQLNLFENNKTEEEQINFINTLAEVENAPAFSFTQDEKVDLENLNKNYKLKDGRYFHFHTNEEGYYYDIYDKNGIAEDGGLLEYSNNEKNETLISIRTRLADFTGFNELADDNLEEISKEDFEEIIKEQDIEDIVVGTPVEIKQEKINYHIINNQLGEGTPKEKYKRNIEAIITLKQCEAENRLATPEEQGILAQYVGWGGLADAFDQHKDNWHNEYEELKELLTEDEYNNAKASTLTAFYTPPIVINSIYQALQNMGLTQANILEPSCGTGNFFGRLPEAMAKSKLYGVELDSITGRIAKQLYQDANIQISGYENADIPDNFYDVAIGNVPFGDFKVNDRRYEKENFLIHDYFFAKTLDKVRSGGIIAFITTKGTMDKKNSNVRKYIAQRADLIGAIRLPNNTFTRNAGTEVTSDIIFLQKRANMTDIIPDWVYCDTDKNGIEMNKYFVDNPEMILGNMEMKSTQFGRLDSTCVPSQNQNLEEQLNYAISNIHAQVEDFEVENELEENDSSIPAEPNVRNFSYTIVNDKVYFRENSKMYLQDIPLTNENRIKGMIDLREQVRQVIDYQIYNHPAEEITTAQTKLNEIYDKFTKEYGLINSRVNATAFNNDSSYFLLCSLEKLDAEGKFIGKADIFSKRTINVIKEVDKVDTSEEALILSISEKAKVDFGYMSKLTSKSKEELITDLNGVIFKIPFEDRYVPADEYLSGNVRAKLRQAELALENDKSYAINVERLKEVVPKDLLASEIGVKLGSTWIPTDVIKQFIFELLETPFYRQDDISVRYSDITSEWYIEGKSYDKYNVKANSTFGTDRINAYKIIEQTLNLKDVKIFDIVIDDEGNKQRVLNRKETAIAQAKQDTIKQAFQDWIWSEPDRRNMLTRIYNDRFNSIKPRTYDGSHLNFYGMNPEIKLRTHQLNAIAHVLYGNNVLLAHEVGAGKTFEMVASSMESKRLGLCNKPLFVVPNHIIEQFASEFLQLYPSANILVSTKKDFETKNRKKFCSRIATGEYDAIIIGHSQFEKIPMSIERQKDLINKQINDIILGIDETKRNRGENFTIKQLEKTKRQLETKLEKLNNQDRKDDVITFEELGIDKLFVDEAHNYKNLFLYTKMRNVGGIAQTEAQKSSDLFLKCRYLDDITGGKGMVFATGTPVSNSIVELYTMQRYLQYDDLKKQGLEHFDNWASTFGETTTAIELAPEGSGYRAKTRFAKFHNLPELMSLFKEIADIQTADTLNLPTPDVENHNVVIKPSQIQKEMVSQLGDRAEKIRNGQVDAAFDNMLKITNEGRKLALDQRLINPLLESAEESKLNACVNNIYDIWNNGKEDKLTQLVFCDLSTPKTNTAYEQEPFSDVYNELKKALIQKGIPENEIKFIHEADTEAKKKGLFSNVRNGNVRVLIGSTPKMGAGTNVQDRLVAIHHIDCPWRPSDLTQRNGRMIRQGNKNGKVHIYSYVTEGTFDAYLYQLVEQKQKFISQIMTSKTPMRTMEDIDEKALSYGEIKALATGNPKILEKTTLDSEVTKLKLIKQNFMSQKYELQDKIAKMYPQQITKLDEKIEAMEYDIIALQNQANKNSDGFSPMTINNITYTEKEDAGKKLLKCCQSIKSFEETDIGEYKGFKMSLYFDSFNKLFTLKLKNKYNYSVDLGTDIYGNITRINNRLEQIERDLPKERNLLDNTKHQLETAKLEVQREFPQEHELQEKQKRLDELNIELRINEQEKELLGDEVEENSDEKENIRELKKYERQV